MSEREKVNILKDVLGGSYKSGSERLYHCPKCNHHKNKLSVNVEKDKFKCWVCDYRGSSVRRIIRSYGNYSHLKSWDKLSGKIELSSFDALMVEKLFGTQADKRQTVKLPPEFRSLTSSNLSISSKPALNFLHKRGVTKSDILRWKIGYCSSGEYEGRIIIPSFNTDGFVDYFIARSYTGDWRKYLAPPVSRDLVFNDLYVDWDNDLTIVEGVFDAIIAGNSVPILGTSLREGSPLVRRVVDNDTPVYLALDADAEKKALEIIKQFLDYDVELYKVDIAPYSDVGEMTKEEFLERKNSATLVSQNYWQRRKIEMLF